MDATGVDFFRYANGARLDPTTIPSDKPGWSLRLAMTDTVEPRFAPGFAWKQFLDNAKLASLMRVFVAERSAFPKIAAIYAATPPDTIRAWQAFHIADAAAPYLSHDFDAAPEDRVHIW